MDAMFPYAERTRDIVVRVATSFMSEQSEPERSRWFWAYHIRIENERATPVQLLTRQWLITDARGMVNRVEGEGVVGEQPVIAPGKSFDYVSGCPLATPGGTMVGAYGMIGDDGMPFEIAIPAFVLSVPVTTS